MSKGFVKFLSAFILVNLFANFSSITAAPPQNYAFTMSSSPLPDDIILHNQSEWTPIASLASSTAVTSRAESWYPLADGLNDVVRAIAISGSDVYAGGDFYDDGSVGSHPDRIARWDGSKWNALGAGITNNAVNSIAVLGSDIYVGGRFVNAGGIANADYIARWDGTVWHALGATALNGYVYSIVVSGSDIYVGGQFFNVGGDTDASYIARWDGSTWHSLGVGSRLAHVYGATTVRAIAVSGSDIYVGGNFTEAGGDPNANYIARWDGSSCHSLGLGMPKLIYNYFYAIAVDGTDVYVGGNFENAGGNTDADTFARWDGVNWHGYNVHYNYVVNAITIDGSDIYVGGDFTSLAGVSTEGIIRYDGETWSAFGSGGLNPYVYTIAVNDSGVYAGGSFTKSGDNSLTLNRIARWGEEIVPRYDLFLPLLLKN